MKRPFKMAVLAATASLVGGLALAVAGTASAATTPPPPVCPSWQVRSIALGETTWENSPVTGSGVVDSHTVKVVKSVDGKTGTSAETSDVGIDLAAATDITVSYKLENGASTAAGAIRFFFYNDKNADTLGTAPTAFVAAEGDATSGTLTIHATGHVGTMGVVYDASNEASGDVVFSNIKVGDVAVDFNDTPCKPSPSPSASATPTPTSTIPPAPVPTPVTGTLPVTG